MNKTDKKLLCIYVAGLLLLGFIALYFEVLDTDMFGCLWQDEDGRAQRMVMETISILFSLAAVYGALRLMSVPRISALCREEKQYEKWATIRWGLLFTSILLCEVTYYFFMSTNVVAFLGICAIAMLFVWPSATRREREMSQFNEENGKHDA